MTVFIVAVIMLIYRYQLAGIFQCLNIQESAFSFVFCFFLTRKLFKAADPTGLSFAVARIPFCGFLQVFQPAWNQEIDGADFALPILTTRTRTHVNGHYLFKVNISGHEAIYSIRLRSAAKSACPLLEGAIEIK